MKHSEEPAMGVLSDELKVSPEVHLQKGAIFSPFTSPNQPTRLRILHADTDDVENPLGGGQPVRTLAINSRLAQTHEVTVLTSVYKGSERSVVRHGVKYRRLGFRVPGLGLSPHLTFLAALGMAARRFPHDLVVEEFTPPVGFCGLPFWTKSPVVLMVQWYFFEQWERRYRLPLKRWMRLIGSRKRYKFVIVQTDAMAKELAPFITGALFRKIPCGVDATAFVAPKIPGDYVLFLGRLDLDHKGLDLLLDGWVRVCSKHAIPLVLAGEGPAREHIERVIRDNRLEHLVRLVGWVDGPAKRELLAGCRILAMPSRYETFGLAALDAMAASKPVVCFNIPHLNEVARPPWAHWVPNIDVIQFADAIAELWKRPQECAEMGALARQQANGYRWDEIARQQESFYREVIRAHSSQ